MKYLLDTQAFLWYVLADPRLTSVARNTIEDATNEIWFSPASYWEIAIKMSVGKYQLTVPHDVFFEAAITDNGFHVLAIEPKHTAVLVSLPHFHKDPFDRLVIAQAISEGLEIISSDALFDQYPVRRIWS